MSKKNEETKNGTTEKIAFVISPIGEPDSPERKRADQILKHIIEPVVSQFGYRAERSDNISKPGIITSQIINHIIDDPLVIADLTGHNPNVFYELAIRHAIKKPTIQIIRKGETIPFDVSTQRTIKVDHQDLDSVSETKKELERQIKAVEKDSTLVDSPISSAVNFQFLRQSGNPEVKALAEFRANLQEIGYSVKEILNKLHEQELRPALTSRPIWTKETRLDEEEGAILRSIANEESERRDRILLDIIKQKRHPKPATSTPT